MSSLVIGSASLNCTYAIASSGSASSSAQVSGPRKWCHTSGSTAARASGTDDTRSYALVTEGTGVHGRYSTASRAPVGARIAAQRANSSRTVSSTGAITLVSTHSGCSTDA